MSTIVQIFYFIPKKYRYTFLATRKPIGHIAADLLARP
jgi:hypothetical protein